MRPPSVDPRRHGTQDASTVSSLVVVVGGEEVPAVRLVDVHSNREGRASGTKRRERRLGCVRVGQTSGEGSVRVHVAR
jgi:hypothetical protein